MTLTSKPGSAIAELDLTTVARMNASYGASYKGVPVDQYVEHIKRGIEAGVIDKNEGFAEIVKVMSEPQLSSHRHSSGVFAPPAYPLPTNVNDDDQRRHMICVRLRCAPADFPFKKMTTFVEGESVFVVLIANGQPVTLVDAVGLYPSDELMSQLRLLIP